MRFQNDFGPIVSQFVKCTAGLCFIKFHSTTYIPIGFSIKVHFWAITGCSRFFDLFCPVWTKMPAVFRKALQTVFRHLNILVLNFGNDIFTGFKMAGLEIEISLDFFHYFLKCKFQFQRLAVLTLVISKHIFTKFECQTQFQNDHTTKISLIHICD